MTTDTTNRLDTQGLNDEGEFKQTINLPTGQVSLLISRERLTRKTNPTQRQTFNVHTDDGTAYIVRLERTFFFSKYANESYSWVTLAEERQREAALTRQYAEEAVKSHTAGLKNAIKEIAERLRRYADDIEREIVWAEQPALNDGTTKFQTQPEAVADAVYQHMRTMNSNIRMDLVTSYSRKLAESQRIADGVQLKSTLRGW